MIDTLGGRKSALLLVMVLLGIGAVFLKGDIPANFLSLLQFSFGAYVAGNVAVHGAEAITSAKTPVEAPPAAFPEEALNKLLDSAHLTQEGVATLQATLTAILQRYPQA